jgi:hypothetical protein
MNALKKHGYKVDFVIEEEGLRCTENDATRLYKPEEVRIVNFYRFEGESDPADMSILYVIETVDGLKGTLSDAFGTYAGRRLSDFIVRVEEIAKKTDRGKVDDDHDETEYRKAG